MTHINATHSHIVGLKRKLWDVYKDMKEWKIASNAKRATSKMKVNFFCGTQTGLNMIMMGWGLGLREQM